MRIAKHITGLVSGLLLGLFSLRAQPSASDSLSWVYPDSLSSYVLQEVVVTAKEEKGVTAASKIGKPAFTPVTNGPTPS